MSGEGDVFFESGLVDFCMECLVEVLLARVGLADKQSVHGYAFLLECFDHFEEVERAFPPGDASGEGDDEFAFGFREFLLPLLDPFCGGLVVGWVSLRIDSAMDDAEFFPGHFRVVFQNVVADTGGHADDGLAAGHDCGVGADGVKAVDGGDELRAGFGGHFAPGQPGNPGGDAGAGVEDIGFFGLKDGSQCADLGEGENGFPVDGELDMPAAF